MPDIKVSFIIVAKNASCHLHDLFLDFLSQDYPHSLVQLILVAGPSKDNTLEYMKNFSIEHPEENILVLENPKGILSSGWNIALSQATGEVILRVDAHTRINKSFISSSIQAISNGKDIVGGHRQTFLPENGFKRILAIADISKFGCGSANYRNVCQAGYVDTLAHAAYRRNVFQTVGGYDERLVRNQDNEIHFRMKKAGYRFYYSPEIESIHYARDEILAFLSQKYKTGFWIGLAVSIHPKCFGIRHFVPGLFVISIFAGILLGVIWNWLFLFTIIITYIFAAIAYSIFAITKYKDRNCLRYFSFLPLIFLLIHLSYGLGTIAGLLKLPLFCRQRRSYVLPRPIK